MLLGKRQAKETAMQAANSQPTHEMILAAPSWPVEAKETSMHVMAGLDILQPRHRHDSFLPSLQPLLRVDVAVS